MINGEHVEPIKNIGDFPGMKVFQRRILCFTCLWLCFVFLTGSPGFGTDQCRDLETDLEAGHSNSAPGFSQASGYLVKKPVSSLRAAGIFSEARRCYQYLDFIWEKFPPTDPARHPALKQKIATLKKRQDNPLAGTLESESPGFPGYFPERGHSGQFR